MAAHTLANQDAFLKDVYTDEKVLEQSFGDNPFLGFVQKRRGKTAGGRRYIQPVEYANPGGAGADYGFAMQDGTVSKYLDFILSRMKQYQRIQINNELLYAAEKKSDAFVEALKEFDRGFRSLGEKIGRRLYRTQGGSLGQLAITGSLATSTLTFTDNAACFNFTVDQVLQFSTTDGSGSLLDGGDITTVTAVDEEAGTVTIADVLSTKIAGVTSSSFVFQRGDYNACLSGLADWLPAGTDRATLLAAAFNNITRSVNPVRLGGVFLDGTTVGDLDAVIIKLVSKVTKYGGKTSHILANPESLSDLEIVSNSKVRILEDITTNVEINGNIVVGFSGYKALCGGRAVEIYPDRNCPSTRLYALQLDTWTLWHTGEWINWTGEMATGMRLRPSENEDSTEARLGSYQNLGCSAPGWNGVARLNPSS